MCRLIKQLIDEERIVHSGIFVEDRFGEADLLPFTISDTDFAVPEAVLATLQERLNHPVFGYTRWNHPQLKEAIQTWYQTRFQTKIEEH